MDDAFRRQLESLQFSHHVKLLQLANDKQKQIEQANAKVLWRFPFGSLPGMDMRYHWYGIDVGCVPKVIEVEDEMRVLLEETESNKKVTEEKMRRLTSVLKDF